VSNSKLESLTGYHFRDGSLLKTALNHSSYINECRIRDENSNERLEFLGDAIFDAVISEYLFNRLEHSEEGELTKKRAAIVRESSLAECANKLGLGDFLMLGKGEENTGGRHRKSILADAMEAVIGAIYVDGGYNAAKQFILTAFSETIESVTAGERCIDFKTAIQERLQTNGDVAISYIIEKEEGPDHNKIFYVKLEACGGVMGRGSGKNKKEAEQNAAKDALKALED
jgi:ribonuclease III